MAESLVLEWLNENEYRSYPLKTAADKELKVRGLGVISCGPFDPGIGGYLINGGASGGQPTRFLSQLRPNDQIEVNGVRTTVMTPPRVTDMSDSTVYVTVDLSSQLASSNSAYYVVKKTTSLDSNDGVSYTLEGIFLDANLVYNDTPGDYAALGRLTSVVPQGGDLLITVYGQPVFTGTDYLADGKEYPSYVRNSVGSLLVIGRAAKWVVTSLAFSDNVQFEPSVITVMDGAWRGVDSLAFNGDTPLTGDVTFIEGYQLGLASVKDKRVIKISAGKGYGLPIGCDRIFGEAAPQDCSEVISFISSAAPRAAFGAVDLIPGPHVSVFPDPDRHRIYVGLNFDKPDICTPPPTRPAS